MYYAQNIEDGGLYKIKHPSSGKVLDIKDASNQNGSILHLWDAVEGIENQVFKFIKLADDYWQIQAYHSNKAIEVRDSSMQSGGTISQWEFYDIPTMKWRIYDAGNGKIYIQNANSGLFMDVMNNNNKNGTPIIQYNPNLTEAQIFKLEKVVN